MARIYTRTGDKGETSLFGGARVSKDDPRIRAYGAVDELSAFVGYARQSVADTELAELLADVQNNLFDMGADLATPPDSKLREALPMLSEDDSKKLEGWIDDYDAKLPPLNSFILPGGTEAAARLHLCRTVCRRAEIALVALRGRETLRQENLVYLNRLSDLLFVLARFVNHTLGVQERPWRKREG